jgi:ligand-binding sensor domain-containing protein
VLSDLNETLVVRITGDQTEFQFAEAGQTVKARVPVPAMIGEPAWDRQRIWVPTSSGLYEVNRATGHMTWLAYEDGNWFLSLLKAGNVLYVATSRGLYCRDIPPCGGN